MKPISPVGTAKPRIARPIYFFPALLCRNAGNGELRVRVSVLTKDLFGVNRRCVVERYTEGFRALEALQDIHVVSERCLIIAAFQPVIPARPFKDGVTRYGK